LETGGDCERSVKRYNVTTLQRKPTVTPVAQGGASVPHTFETLEAYQVAREFRVAMYAVTRRLPNFEKFELASQIRRAAVSLTNNIAEGHGRYHYLDQIRFMLQARGSAEELVDDLNVCSDEKYLSQSEVETLKQSGWRAVALINGYIRYLREKKSGAGLALKETSASCASDDEFSDLTL
jgi:four helix bundle protein